MRGDYDSRAAGPWVSSSLRGVVVIFFISQLSHKQELTVPDAVALPDLLLTLQSTAGTVKRQYNGTHNGSETQDERGSQGLCQYHRARSHTTHAHLRH